MYSLVNVATLVRDLARRPSGAAVADDLLRAFALDADALADLDRLPESASEARQRARVVATEAARPRALAVLAAARDVADDLGVTAYAAACDALEQATLGDADDLRRFVRDEVLTGAWEHAGSLAVARFPRALDVVTDGVVGSWAGDTELGRPWRTWLAATRLEPAPTAWPEVVAAVQSVPRAAPWSPAPATWSLHMHDACWAVHLSGRLRDAAVAQLHTLRTVCAAYAPEVPPLRVVAAAVAATHATVVADLLPGDTYRALTQPLFRLLP